MQYFKDQVRIILMIQSIDLEILVRCKFNMTTQLFSYIVSLEDDDHLEAYEADRLALAFVLGKLTFGSL